MKTNLKKYDVFLFDADNTLFDYDLAEEHAFTVTMENHGLTFTEQIRKKYREINDSAWHSYERGEITKTEFQHSRFRQFFEHMKTGTCEIAFNEGYVNIMGECSFLIEGAAEICKAITESGKKLYIVTNGLLSTQNARTKHSAISQYIADSFVSEVVGFEKPHIKYFEHVLSDIPTVQKDRILIIGDNLHTDIIGGINAGIDTCWFNLFAEENKTGIEPTYEILKLSELNKFI